MKYHLLRLKNTGLTINDFIYLTLVSQGTRTMGALSSGLGMKTTAVNRQTNKLVRQGLLEVQYPNEKDQRLIEYHVTPEASKKLEAAK